jgi:hypothetical protein
VAAVVRGLRRRAGATVSPFVKKKSWGRGNWRPPVGGPEVAAPLDPPRRRPAWRRGRLRRGCRAWTANEPESLRLGTASRQTPAILLHAAKPPTRRRL